MYNCIFVSMLLYIYIHHCAFYCGQFKATHNKPERERESVRGESTQEIRQTKQTHTQTQT